MEITFVLPLALLPGVALLIVSTSARYDRLHDEIHLLAQQDNPDALTALHRRAYFFRNALAALYLCVAIFALTGLVGVMLELSGLRLPWLVVILTGAGCLCLLYAAAQLIRETLLSLDVIKRHLKHIHRHD